MLVIDGVKYELWTPPTEDEFEQVVKEHAEEIFGDNSIYIDIKHKIKSEAGIGSIPDGYVIMLGDTPGWGVIEVELVSHNPYDHIVSQIGKFIKGIKNPFSQQEIVGAIYDEITKDAALAMKARKAIASGEIHKFVSDCVSKPPEIMIVIEEETPELDEAIETLAHRPRVVELRTFISAPDISTHAHLFEPLTLSVSSKATEGEDLLWKLRQELTRLRADTRPKKPTGRYFKVSTGHSGIHLELLRWGENRIGIELHLERTTLAENKRVLEKIKEFKDDLERGIGEPLVFQPQWTKKWSRVYTVKEIKETPEFKQWAVGTIIKFFDNFKPLLDKVDVV